MDRLIRRTLRSIVPVIVAATLLAVAAPAYAAEPVFVVTGRGWGHGIGMSQEGSRGFAKAGWKYDRILAHYYQKTTLGSISTKQIVRVSLQRDHASRASWILRGNGGELWVDYGAAPTYVKLSKGLYYTFVASGNGVRVFRDTDGDGTQDTGEPTVNTFTTAISVWERTPSGAAGVVQVHSKSGPWDWNDVVWRGTMRILPGTGADAGKLFLIDHVNMEDYLRGVVPRETPASYPIESLKTQAVAARSYAYKSLRPSSVYDVRCTTVSQVYNGYGRWTGSYVDRHEEDSSDQAVAATAGQVVKYGSSVVQAFFFSTSGGRTESIQNVWSGSAAVPYFTSVADPYEAATAPFHTWSTTKTFTATDLRARLSGSGITVPAAIVDVVVTKRGPSGRATEVVLKGAAGDDKTVTLSKVGRIRTALALWDTWFYFTKATVTAPASAAYGVPFTVKASVSPALSGGLGVAYGAAGATSLAGRSTATLKSGGGYATIPGQTSAADIMVSSGSKGYGNLFISPRVRVPLSRRLSAAAAADGDRITLTAGIAPATGAGTVAFEALQPGTTTWRQVAVSTVSAGGGASYSMVAKTPGTWRFRVRHAGGSGFVAGISAERTAYAITDARLVRFAGTDRYDTAVRIARASGPYPRGGWAVVASGVSMTDSLCGASLASSVDGPLLLTNPKALSAAPAAWLRDKANGVHDVYVVGGTGAVDAAVVASLESILGTGKVHRIAGTDSYGTAAKVAAQVKANTRGWTGGVVIANKAAMTDAAAVSALSAAKRWPLLYVDAGKLPAATHTALDTLGVKSVWIAGGTGVVGAGVATEIGAHAPVTRASGATRYDTALDIAAKAVAAGASYNRIGLASDSGLADALALGPYVARGNGVLLLTPRTALYAPVGRRITSTGASLQLVAIGGGSAVVSEPALDQVTRALP